MRELLRKIASRLPYRWQQELKRRLFSRQLKRGSFTTDEKEFDRLESWVRPGDWVLDIGANVGHYACKLSRLVGPTGRVIAIEPVPATFELLAANVAIFPCQNVTLLNIAASEKTAVFGMAIPRFTSGLRNLYMAHLTQEPAEFQVVCLPVDSLGFVETVSLAKIDVEGHELSVLKGMEALLRRDHPVLIVEGWSEEVEAFLRGFGYLHLETGYSVNRVFVHARDASNPT